MLEKNTPLPLESLEELVGAITHRHSLAPGCAYTRLMGLRPNMGLPTIKPKISEEQQKRIIDALKQYRAKVAGKRKKKTLPMKAMTWGKKSWSLAQRQIGSWKRDR